MQIHVSREMNVLTLHFPFSVLSPFIYDVYILYIASSCAAEQHREWEKMLSAFLRRVKEVQKKAVCSTEDACSSTVAAAMSECLFSDEGRYFKVCMKCKFTMSVLKMLVIDLFTFVCVCVSLNQT